MNHLRGCVRTGCQNKSTSDFNSLQFRYWFEKIWPFLLFAGSDQFVKLDWCASVRACVCMCVCVHSCMHACVGCSFIGNSYKNRSQTLFRNLNSIHKCVCPIHEMDSKLIRPRNMGSWIFWVGNILRCNFTLNNTLLLLHSNSSSRKSRNTL